MNPTDLDSPAQRDRAVIPCRTAFQRHRASVRGALRLDRRGLATGEEREGNEGQAVTQHAHDGGFLVGNQVAGLGIIASLASAPTSLDVKSGRLRARLLASYECVNAIHTSLPSVGV